MSLLWQWQLHILCLNESILDTMDVFIKSLFKFLAKKQYLKVHKLVFTNLNTIEWNRLPAYETLYMWMKKKYT